MSNWIGPIVKHSWTYAMQVLHKIFGLDITQQLSAWGDPAFIFNLIIIKMSDFSE